MLLPARLHLGQGLKLVVNSSFNCNFGRNVFKYVQIAIFIDS